VRVSWEKVCVADLEWAIKVGGFTLRLLWMSGGIARLRDMNR
jgi:hypothetical protein